MKGKSIGSCGHCLPVSDPTDPSQRHALRSQPIECPISQGHSSFLCQRLEFTDGKKYYKLRAMTLWLLSKRKDHGKLCRTEIKACGSSVWGTRVTPFRSLFRGYALCFLPRVLAFALHFSHRESLVLEPDKPVNKPWAVFDHSAPISL